MNELTELVFIGRDNAIDVELREDGVAVDLSNVTRVRLELYPTEQGSTDAPGVVDSSITPAAFDFATDATEGILHILLGGILSDEGAFRARLVTFDPDNPLGLVWTHERGTGACAGTVLTIRALDAQDAA